MVDFAELGGFSGLDFGVQDPGGGGGGGEDFTFISDASAPLYTGVPDFASFLGDAYSAAAAPSSGSDFSMDPFGLPSSLASVDLGNWLTPLLSADVISQGPATSTSTPSKSGSSFWSKLANALKNLKLTAGAGAGSGGGSATVKPASFAGSQSQSNWVVWLVIGIVVLLALRGLFVRGR